MLMTSDLLEPIDETDMSYKECGVALVLGNGESRAWFNPSETKIQTKDVVTWGCNAIYRDGDVNNLVYSCKITFIIIRHVVPPMS